MEETAVRCLREWADEDPQLGRAIAAAWYKKHSGVELPVELDWEEQLFREGVEGSPHYKEEFIKARLRDRGVEFPEEQDALERLIAETEQLQRLRDALGVGRKGIADIVQELIPALPGLLQIVNDARRGAIAGASSGQSPDVPVEPIVSHLAQPKIKPPETTRTPSHLLRDIQPGDNGAGDPPLDRVDWVELEIGVHGDPVEFIQRVYRAGYDQDSLYHRQLARLFQDNLPEAILDELSKLVGSVVADGEDYEVAVLVLKHLNDTNAKRLWLTQAHASAVATRVGIDQAAAGEIGLPGTDGDDDEEFDAPMLI